MKRLIALLASLVTAVAVGQIPVSKLPQATLPLTGAEIVPVTQNGISRQATVSEIASGGGAPGTAPFVLVAPDAGAPNGRVLTGTTNQVSVTDSGPGTVLTLSTPQNIDVTATPTFGGLTLTPLTGLLKGNGSSPVGVASASDVISLWAPTCDNTTFLRGDGTCAPGSSGITSISAGTGIVATPNPIISTGTIALDTPVLVANGGIGVGTLTGIAKGNGTSAFSAAASSDVISLWSGVCDATSFLRGDGACAATGTVTSVGLADGSSSPIFSITGSPVTGSGTLTETLATQNANVIFAGPTTGGAAQPTFRGLVTADLFNNMVTYQKIQHGLSDGLLLSQNGLNPTELPFTGSTTDFLRADGTFATPPTVAGANPTASVGLTAVNGAATTYLRSDGAPALSQAIAPTWTGLHTFTPGGTHAINITTGDLQLNGSAGSSGNVLTSAGAGVLPTWTAPTAVPVGANPTGTVGLSTVNGAAATFLRSDGAPALSQAIAPTWTGLHTFTPGGTHAINVTTGDIQLNGSAGSSGNVLTSAGAGVLPTWTAPASAPVGANPTGTVGLSIVNGSAATWLRSDGAPALSQAIIPTWTGAHTFTNSVSIAPTATGTVLSITETPTIANFGIKIAGINQPTDGDIWVVSGGTPNSSNSVNLMIDRANSLAAGVGQGPNILLRDTNAPSNSTIQHAGGHLEFYNNSNNGGAQLAMSITGSQSVNIAITGRGPTASALVDMNPDKGTFTITLATGCSTTPTGTATWNKMGNLIALNIPTITCTGNATGWTFTGLPAAIQPGSTFNVLFQGVDNTLTAIGYAALAASGTITLSKVAAAGTTSSSGWTGSGTRTWNAQVLTYMLNK